MMRRLMALCLAAAMASGGCASAGSPRLQQAGANGNPRTAGGAQDARTQVLMADFVKQLAIGKKVRVELYDGRRIRGTLMKATDDAIVVRERTRIPEPPIEIPLARVAGVELESGGSSLGRAIGVGVAAAVGSVMLLFAIFAAAYSD